MLKNIRMGTVVLNQSNFDKSDFELLNASHSPSLILLEEDVDLGGNTLYFVPGDVLRANGGTLGNGTLSGIVGIEDTCQQLFRLDNDKCSVTFAEDIVLNVPYLRPEWFGAKGDLVFERNVKGNFDLDKEGSYYEGCNDDSAAINETIRVAEELSIKTVKFNAVNYFVGKGIVIHKGNLHLEGSGALLREDQWYEYEDKEEATGHANGAVWNSRTSTLFCPKGVNLITIGEEYEDGEDVTYPTKYADSMNPGDPIVISNLQLWTEGDPWSYYQSADKLPSGINFCTYCSAPLWPFIIERCHFRNFMYAIHINSIIDYPVTNLRINECAFFHNMYCLFSERRDKTATTGVVELEPTLQTSWSLEFTRNKCHNNGFVMKMCVNKGPCRVEYNNLESAKGFNREDKSEPGVFAIDLELGQRAAAVIRYNHFEVSRPRLARVKGFWGLNWVTMLHNNTDGNIGEYAASNLCYFDSVVLNTDEDAEVHNCIIEDAPYNGKSLRIAEALDAGNANRFPIGSVYLRGLPARWWTAA